MKILLAINSLCGAGAEVFVTQLSVSLTTKGHKVYLINYAGNLDEKGVNLYNQLIENGVEVFDLSRVRKIFLPFYYIKIVQRIKPDVIHSNLEQSDFFIIFTKLFSKAKYVRTLHNIKMLQIFPIFLHKFLFSLYDLNIGCSQFIKNNFECSSLRDRILVVDNGIDLTNIEMKQNNSDSIRESLGINSNDFVFVVVGTLKKRFDQFQKGHDIIFEAFSKIPQMKCHVLFLGNCESIQTDFKLELIKDKRFHFLGIVNNVTDYLRASNVLLAPSRFEGLPISTIEGVCIGLPLICSNIDGFRPFVHDSTIVVESNSVDSLVNGLLLSIEKYSQLKVEAENLKNNYRRTYDINQVSEKYICSYLN